MRNAKSPTQAGFSLVETVAAMGILALAAIPLMQVTTTATRNTASLEERLLARTVAENVMARAMATSDVIDGGIATGEEVQLGRSFVWTRTATPAQSGGLQNLSVDVRPAEREQILASLISLKYAPQALPGTGTAPANEGDGS